MKIRDLALVSVFVLTLFACSGAATGSPTAPAGSTQAPSNNPFEPAEIENDEGGVVTITGEVAYTNPFFTATVAQPLVILEDQTGFVDRDRGYLMPPESQTMGHITSDFFTSPFTYSLSLPIEPEGGQRDLDNDGGEDPGVLVFAPAYWTNAFGEPFLEERDLYGGGWSGAYVSTKLSEDAATEGEYVGGKLIVYAPDNQQGFPSGFGADAMLFTEDDPIVGIPQGYTMVDMDTTPFTFDRSREVVMDLLEPEGAALDDFSDLSYVEAFDAMLEMMREEYAFTELKDIDWDNKIEEFRPAFEQATEDEDPDAYAFALRDFLWSIPDGHVGFSFTAALNDAFVAETAAGLGMAIRETDDGRVIVNFLTPDSPAEVAGIQLGAEISAINGTPINEAISASVPWSSPFSTEHTLRLQQLRYVVRFEAGAEVEVEFKNPTGSVRMVTLDASSERESFTFSSFAGNTDGTELPVEWEIMDNGYGYVAIYSFFDNEVLTIQLWERMIKYMNEAEIQGLVLDLRINGGGSGFIADQMAAYFFEERLELGNTAMWDESVGDFYVDPNTPDLFYPPPEDLRYLGKLAVIVAPSCSSACEFFASDMTVQDRALIVGQYPTGGLGGSVKDFNMPDGISVRFPIGRPLDLEGNVIIEGVGIVPDVKVPVNETTLINAGDPLLAAAVEALDKPRGAGVVPSGPPTIDGTVILIDELNAGVPFLDELARETYTEEETGVPGTLTYTVVMNRSRDVIVGYFWCTTTNDILADNWAKISPSFELDGVAIPVSEFHEESVASGTSPCKAFSAKLSDWPAGEHSFVADITFTSALNDGFGDYAAGHYITEFTIYVEN